MPIALSVLAGIIWALIMLLYVLFLSSNFYWLQDLAVFVLSLIATGGMVGLVWMYWIFKRR
jgi:membrane protein DedA with SNARE-associated domain